MKLINRLCPSGFARPLVCSIFSPLALSVSTVFLAATLCAQNSFVNFEGKQTSPVRLSPDGTRLFVVNTPDARLSVFDVTQPSNPRLISEIPVGIEPVSVNPRNNDEAWVVNEVSDSISIVSVSQNLVTDTISVKDEPVDVVFAGGQAFVSASRKNLIAVFDAITHSLVTNIAVFGENPRAMAVNAAGTKVYAAFALSGNHTTLVPPDKAPPQSPNTNSPPQVSLIVDARDATYRPPLTNIIVFNMPDNDVVEIDVPSLSISRYFTSVGTVNLGLAIRPGSGDLYVANTDARNMIHFEPNQRGRFVTNQISRIDLASGTVTRFDLNPGFITNIASLSYKTNALAQPTAIAFEPDGSSFYVAAFGSDRVAKIDATDPNTILARIEICPTAIGSASDSRNKRGPRGLALNSPAQRLYVVNRIANTLSIVDTAANTVLKEIPVGSHDPTPAVIRQGRGFLYDAKLSGNGTVSCASCHIDAEMDLLAWDLGDPAGQFATNTSILPPFNITSTTVYHPMKGPMTTQTLRGLNGLDPLHWRGDRTNFTQFNGAFASLLGGSVLPISDMNAYRDFINTIAFQPNPNQNLDRSYPTNFAGGNASAGRNAFFFTNYTGSGVTALQCNSCHTGPPGPGSDHLIIPAAALQESQDFKVPQLRAIYQKMNFNNTSNAASIGGFGIVHDGQDPTLQVFLSRPVFANIRTNTTIKNNLAAFVQCFDTGTAPAVGYSRTISSNNVNNASVSNDWALLESQASLGNIDLIAKGSIDGRRHGFVYQPGSGNYRPDTTNSATLTTLVRSQLAAKIQNGDKITIMGVPPGSGVRMGIDRDEDGLLDADVPPPSLHIAQGNGNAVLNWPLTAAGFALEATDSFSPTNWTNVADPLEIVSGQNIVTNSPAGAGRFYRLRLP